MTVARTNSGKALILAPLPRSGIHTYCIQYIIFTYIYTWIILHIHFKYSINIYYIDYILYIYTSYHITWCTFVWPWGLVVRWLETKRPETSVTRQSQSRLTVWGSDKTIRHLIKLICPNNEELFFNSQKQPSKTHVPILKRKHGN